MSSLLQQLENNEAILLMYLADELSPEDRVEVEHLLANDPALRQMLDNLVRLEAKQRVAIQELDDALPLEQRRGMVVRRAARAIRQWDIARRGPAVSENEAEETERARRWVFYPLGAAASILLGMLLWWGYSPPRYPEFGPERAMVFSSFPPFESQDYLPLSSIEDEYAALIDLRHIEPYFGLEELLIEELN